MCAGSRLKLSIAKESSRVASRPESCIELFTVEKSSLSIDRRTVSCRQWLYNRVYAVYCLRAELRIFSCTAIHLCCVFVRTPVPTKFCFLK